MKRFSHPIAIALLTLLVVGPRHATAAEVSSTFDTGFDGWSAISLDTSGGGFGWSWQPDGGNSGGFAQFQVHAFSAPYFNWFESPASLNGNWSALEGIGAFRYDVRLTGDSSGMQHALVVVGGPGGLMAFDRAQAAGDGWLTISAPLVQSEWQIRSGSWEEVMSDVSSVRIYPVFNGMDPGRVVAFDNIMLVPEPSSWLLLSVGLGTLLVYRRCRRKSDHANVLKHES